MQMKMKTRLRTSFLVLVSILTMAAYGSKSHATQKIPATLKPLESVIFYPKQEVSAIVLPVHDATVSAQTQGQIESWQSDIGKFVNKGDILVKLNCDDQQANAKALSSGLSGIKAKINFYEWQLKQNKRLATQNNASQERVKTNESELAFYKAQLQTQSHQLTQANLQVSRCNIKAPFDGVITHKLSDLGEYVTPGKPVLRMVSKDDLQVQVHAHPVQASLLPKAKHLFFKDEGHFYPVKLASKVQSLDLNTHTQEVRFEFKSQKPLPGTLGTIVWEDARAHIPAEYISQRGHQLGLFISERNKAKFVPIKDAAEGRPVLLPDHIAGQIVIEGRHQLNDGYELLLNTEKGQNNEVA